MTPADNPTPLLRYLRSALGPSADGPSDAALLARFAAERDEAAFELLVWRHAGMVLRVCRSVLRDHHAAEDATQAAFLTLARKASSIGQRQAVAAWLYRVAYRLAVRQARKRSVVVAELDQLPARPASVDPELARLLHDELDRLPDKYRAPLLLCFFDGLTHAEAAKRLGWPVGTIASRIARAKEQLHARLTQRGVTIPVAGLAALFATDMASALAPSFAGITTRAAIAYVAGETIIPGVSMTVLQLTKGAMRTMTLLKLQWAAGVFVACGTLTVGGVWATGQGPGTAPATANKTAASKAKPKKEPLAERRATMADRKRSLSNLKQIIIAIHGYHDAHGRLPTDIRDKNGKPLLSWRVAILPYLDVGHILYSKFKLDEPWDSEHNKKLLIWMRDEYRTNFQPKNITKTYYQVFAGPGTPFDPKVVVAVPGATSLDYYQSKVKLQDITDGLSNTLGVIEAGPPVPWTKPADIPYDPKKPLTKLVGPFSNEWHVAMMDGSTYALKRNIDPKALRSFIEANDGRIHPDIETFRAPIPAETPEDKALIQEMLHHNQKLIAEIDQLMKERIKLLGNLNRATGVLNRDDELTPQLELLAGQLKEMNRRLQVELGLRPKTDLPQLRK